MQYYKGKTKMFLIYKKLHFQKVGFRKKPPAHQTDIFKQSTSHLDGINYTLNESFYTRTCKEVSHTSNKCVV